MNGKMIPSALDCNSCTCRNRTKSITSSARRNSVTIEHTMACLVLIPWMLFFPRHYNITISLYFQAMTQAKANEWVSRMCIVPDYYFNFNFFTYISLIICFGFRFKLLSKFTFSETLLENVIWTCQSITFRYFRTLHTVAAIYHNVKSIPM